MSSKRRSSDRAKSGKVKKRKSKRHSKSKDGKRKSAKSRRIQINYENPPIPAIKGHTEFDGKVESVEICSDVSPLDDMKYDDKRKKYEDKFYDEVEMKGHGLVDEKGHHAHPSGTNNGTSPHHIPFDEVAMKQSGLVDDHCHHMTETELRPTKSQPDVRPHVNLASTIEAISLKGPSTAVGTSEVAASEEECVITLRDSLERCRNILDDLKYKHEYIEYRTGDKGRAMAVWPDGTEDTYEFTGETVYQIPRTPSK